MENKEEKKGVQFDPIKFLRLCIKEWWAFATCIAACVALAVLYVVVRKPVVEVDAQLMLPPETSGGASSLFGEMAAVFNMGDMFGGNSTDNEMAIMGSYSVFLKTAQDMGLNTAYLQKPKFRWKPAFYKHQLQLTTLPSINDTLSVNMQFDLEKLSNGNFDIKLKIKAKKTITRKFKDQSLPVTLDTDYGPFTIEKTEHFGKSPCDKFRITFCSYTAAAQNYQTAVKIYSPNKKTDLIALSFLTPVAEFGEALLNTIIDNYNMVGNIQRLDRDNRTMQFLNERIDEIKANLDLSEGAVLDFKRTHDLTNVEYNASTLLARTTEFDNQLFAMQTELELVEVTRDFLNDPANNYSLLPAINVAAESIANYNSLILSRMDLLNSAKENNKTIQLLNQQIDALRGNIQETVERAYQNQKLRIAEFKKEHRRMKGLVDSIPSLQQEYSWLVRTSGLDQQLYLYLVKQREETALSLSKITPTLVTVDAPYTLTRSPGMGKVKVLILAFMFGGFLALVWIYYFRLPHAALANMSALKADSKAPVIGNVKRDPDGIALSVLTPGRGETVRMLRSELDFILKGFDGKTMLITSADNDGDSAYVASNLAAAFAMQGSKTLLVDANMHQPTMTEIFNIGNKNCGIASLVGMAPTERGSLPTASVGGKTLWVLPAGHCSLDPSDVLSSTDFAALIDGYKDEYAYIVINCPSLNSCSDTYSVSALADMTIVNLSLATDRPDEVQMVNSLTEAGRLPRIAVVAIS